EFDERDVALRVAEHHLARRIEQRIRLVLDRGPRFLGFGELLVLLELRHRLLQRLGVLEQVVLDDLLDLAALRGGEILRGRRQCGERKRGGKGERADELVHCVGPVRDEPLRAAGPMVNLLPLKNPALASFNPTMSSARTQPGDPVGKRVFARAASSRAVFMSPRASAACAEARSASATSPLRPYAIASCE